MIKCVCVFTGSSPGALGIYSVAARELGTELVRRDIALVYGGARVGLMGQLANAVLAADGTAIGVMPSHLVENEVAHKGLSELHVVASMHERKALMAKLADAVIALPGGLGTLDEFAEMLTWAQLGLHRKPCGILNVAGYYDLLLAFLDHAVNERFVTSAHRQMIISATSTDELLDQLDDYEPLDAEKWIDR